MKTPFVASTVSLLLLLAALGGYTALRVTVDDESVAVSELNRQITAKTAEAARLTSVRERLAALADVEQRIDGYFVSETGVVAFINELQSRGSALGATVEISSVAAAQVDKGGRPALNIALSIAGPFDAVMRTLGSIEYAPYDLSINHFSLVSNSDKKTWLALVTLTAGSTKNTTSAPATSAPPETASTTSATSTGQL